MPTRDTAPTGSPCWVDLWTSDVEGSRRFYSELFGWKAEDPSPEFGGYFMFTRDGVPVAGGMGDMGDMKADNTWKVFLETDDLAKALETSESLGAQVIAPAMAVADLGSQAVLVDPTGAVFGAWQPGTFPGFTVFGEHGALSWCELLTREYEKAVEFYRASFGWDTATVSDTDEFRYTTLHHETGEAELAGIMDAAGFLPEAIPSHWSIFWEVDELDAAVAKLIALGGSVVSEARDTPYGRLGGVTDPTGAQFKLRQANS
ncbi:MAG: VOC family protein [Acidimicrobiales bacterium]